MQSKFAHSLKVSVVSMLLGYGLAGCLASIYDVDTITALVIGLSVGLTLSCLEPFFRD